MSTNFVIIAKGGSQQMRNSACMPTVYYYPVKLTIADLIRAKSIILCLETQFSRIINQVLTSLNCSDCTVNYQTSFFFAWTSLFRRSVHTKKPRSDISQYRPHARSISLYYSLYFHPRVLKLLLFLLYRIIQVNHRKKR